jgi:drug/metabolite transporter (DMT)-like permease
MTAPIPSHRPGAGPWRGPLLLVLATGIWGSLYVVSKDVLHVLAPWTLLWWRYVIALPVLAVLGLVSRQSWRLRREHLGTVLVVGLSGYVVSVGAQFVGTQLANAEWGAVITATTPAFMIVLARPLLGERITGARALAVLLAIMGAILMVGVGRLPAGYLPGAVALGVAAASWAFMSVWVKRLPPDLPSWTATFYAMAFAAVVLTPPVAASALRAARHLTPPTALGVLYVGAVCTAGAFYLWNLGLQSVAAGTGGVYFVAQPLVGTALAVLVLHEPLGWHAAFGAALVMAAIVVVSRSDEVPDGSA